MAEQVPMGVPQRYRPATGSRRRVITILRRGRKKTGINHSNVLVSHDAPTVRPAYLLLSRTVLAVLIIRSAVRRLLPHSVARSAAEGCPPDRSSPSTLPRRSSPA